MNAFSRLVTPGDVLLDLEAPNARVMFERLADKWQRLHGVDASEVAGSLLARENLGSTGLGEGVAIPHARIARLGQAIAAVVRLNKPIPFGSPDGQPVRHCFVLLVPQEATEAHLQILAASVQMLGQAQFRRSLDACGNADEACKLLSTWQETVAGRDK